MGVWKKLRYDYKEDTHHYVGDLKLENGSNVTVEVGYIGTRAGQFIKWYEVTRDDGSVSFDHGLSAFEYEKMSRDFRRFINDGPQ